MLEELKRKSLKSRIPLCVVLLAAAAVMLFITDFGALKAVQGARDLDTLPLDTLEGRYVETEIYFIYEWYAGTQSVDNATNKATITEKEYIIPVGEDEFMGALVQQGMLDQAEKLMEASQKVLMGESREIGEGFMAKGTVCKMDKESLEYYHEVMGYEELSSEDQQRCLPLVLKIDYLGRTPQWLTWGLTAAAALCICGTLWMIVASLTGWYQRDIQAFCRKSAFPDALMEQLDSFYHDTRPVHGLRMGQWILFAQGGKDILVDSGDILWAYERTVRHTTNGIPSGTSFGIVLRTRNPKKQYEVAMKNENAARETLGALHSAYPRMVIGYSPVWERLYNAHRDMFMRLTEPE